MPSHHEVLRRQGGAIARRQLVECGIDHRFLRRAVERGDFVAVRRHVFVSASAPPTWAQRAWVALLEAPPGALLSHRTAARLHRLGRFNFDAIDVLEEEGDHHRPVQASRRRTTVVLDHHRTQIDGLPVTSLARTVFDLCGLVSVARHRRGLSTLTPAQVERALDDALAGLLTVQAAHRILAELGRRGRPGTALMRSLMDVRGEGYVATESELEDLVQSVLITAGLPLPLRQASLGTAENLIGRVDFVYPDALVVIEADGRKHHTARRDADADRWRDLELAAAGYIVIRVTWHQLVHEPERFITALRSVLDRRRPNVRST